MITLSPTKARANLTSWLKKASEGESIAILYGDQVISLKPIEVEALDYASSEYQISSKEMKSIEKNLASISRKEIQSKKSKIFKGSLEKLL